MEKEIKKVKLSTIIFSIIIVLLIFIIIVGTIILNQKNKETIKDLQEQVSKMQNSIMKAEESKNNSEKNTTTASNQIFNLTNSNEYNQYTEMELNGKKVVIKLKQTIIASSKDNNNEYNETDAINSNVQIAVNDSEYKKLWEGESYVKGDVFPKIVKIQSEEGKEYIAIVSDKGWTTEYIKIFNENCNYIGEIKYCGRTTFIIKNNSQESYEFAQNSITIYNFHTDYGKENGTADYAMYKYTIKNDKIVENIIQTYKDNQEEGTTCAGAA